MSDFLKEGDVAGTSFRVGDCHIWAEIAYLDSLTDYQEYLPKNDARAPSSEGELVMLDSAEPDPKTFTIVAVSGGVVLLLLAYLVCFFVESL